MAQVNARLSILADMMMTMMDGMGWGMGLIGLLVATLLILAIAALIKYLFS